MNILNIEHVSKVFGEKVVLDDVSYGVHQGDKIGIIGINGTGKSTILKIIGGLEEPDEGQVITQNGLRITYLPQMPEFPQGASVLDYVAEGKWQKDWSTESEARNVLNKLGITDHEEKIDHLSGGQKKRVALARTLVNPCDVLLLDEPTNHLDIHAIKWLEDFLMNFENTVIVVSHDRHFLNKVCTNIADIDYGKITMFVGNYDFWYSYTQMTQRQLKDQNKRVEQKIKELQDFIQRFSANASKAKQATSRKKLLDNLQMDTIKPSSRRYPFCSFKQDREVGNDVLLVDGISKTIDGQ